MAILNKDQILAADDLKSQQVATPEWGGEVIVKTLTGEERDSLEAAIVSSNGKSVVQNRENIRAKLLVRSLVDEHGQRLFTDTEVSALGRKSGKVLDRLFDIATDLSKVTPSDVEELAKNSETGPSAGSGS